MCYLDVTAERVGEVRAGARVLDLNLAQAEAVADVVAAKLEVYDARGSRASR